MGKMRPRPCGGVVVQFVIAGECGLRRTVGNHGGRRIALVHLDAVTVEFVALLRDRLIEPAAAFLAFRCCRLARLHILARLRGIRRRQQSDRFENRLEIADTLVGALDDLLPHRLTLRGIAVEQRRGRLVFEHVFQLPAQIIGVLDRCIGAEPVGRRMAVHGVPHAKHPARRIMSRIHLVDRPGRSRTYGDVERLVADQIAHDGDRFVVAEFPFALRKVVAPDEQPLVPRPYHAHHAGADAADLRARLQHPVQHARPVCDVFGQIDLGDDVHAAGAAHFTFHRQADDLRNAAAAAVGADQIFGADLVSLAGKPVLHGCGDMGRILNQIDEFGVEADSRSALAPGFEQDRLQKVLRQVAYADRTSELIVGAARGMVTPGIEPPELFAGEALAEHVIRHQVLLGRLGERLLLKAEIPQDFHRPLVGDVSARRIGEPTILGHQNMLDAVHAQQCRRRRAGRSASNDEHIGFDHIGHCPLHIVSFVERLPYSAADSRG